MKILVWEMRTSKVHIDGVIEEIRNRKIYDKQHRKRQGVADIVST